MRKRTAVDFAIEFKLYGDKTTRGICLSKRLSGPVFC